MAQSSPRPSRNAWSSLEEANTQIIVFLPSFLAIIGAPESSAVRRAIDVFTLSQVLWIITFISRWPKFCLSETILKPKFNTPAVSPLGRFERPQEKPYGFSQGQNQVKYMILCLASLSISILVLWWARGYAFVLVPGHVALADSSLALYVLWCGVKTITALNSFPSDCTKAPAELTPLRRRVRAPKHPINLSSVQSTYRMPLGPIPSKLQASILPDSSGSVVRLKRAVRNASLVSRPESCRRSPIRTRRVIKRSQAPLTTILKTTALNRGGQESPLAAQRLLNAVVSSPEVFSIHGTPCNTSNEIFVTRHRFRESAESQLSRGSSRPCRLLSSAVDLCDDSFEDSLTAVNLLQHNQPIEVEPKSSQKASKIPLGMKIMHLGLIYWVFKQALRSIGYPTTVLRFTVVTVVQTATRLTLVIFRAIFFYPLMFMGIVTKSLQIRLGEEKSLVEKLQTRALPPPGMDNQTRSLDFFRWLLAALQR